MILMIKNAKTKKYRKSTRDFQSNLNPLYCPLVGLVNAPMAPLLFE